MRQKGRQRVLAGVKLFAASAGGALLAVFFLSKNADDTHTGIDRYTETIAKIGMALSSLVAGCIGGWVPVTTALAAIMAMDYVSGFIVGLAGKSRKTPDGKLSSSVGFIGLLKKGMMLAVVALAHMIDTGVGIGTNTFRDLACGWYIGNEGLSFYENMKLLGVPFPAPLKKVLDKIKKTGELPQKTEDNKEGDVNE